jgi:preprotein translocase subunit SecA
VVYRTEGEKFDAVVNGILQEDNSRADGIRQLHERGQPVLVGSISIEKSERLSALLKKAGIPHQVLNAKQHEREAKVIAQAGRKGSVTVSTNMAGRGTDILLGGNPEHMTREHCLKNKIAMPYAAASAVIGANGSGPESGASMVLFQHEGRIFQVPLEQWKPTYEQFAEQCRAEHDEVVGLGGLHILGTERHEARRIDNQLRGRAGRQGDPGSSRFYLSLQDDLLRIFGGERIQKLMLRLGMEEDVPIESRMISKRIEAAQKAVEAQNFESRKHLLEYDDVMNKQREAVYGLRRRLLEGIEQKEYLQEIMRDLVGTFVELRCPPKAHPDTYGYDGLRSDVLSQFGVKIDHLNLHELSRQGMVDEISELLNRRYAEKEALLGAEAMRYHERMIMLQNLDSQWKDHLLYMDHLKEGIGLRGYGQKDPLVEYKKESFDMFQALMDRIEDETLRYLFFLQPVQLQQVGNPDEGDELEDVAARQREEARQEAARSSLEDFTRNIKRKKERELAELQLVGAGGGGTITQVIKGEKVGRNDPCPCGSGKKYKKCHGA